jgi:hypothetical protein
MEYVGNPCKRLFPERYWELLMHSTLKRKRWNERGGISSVYAESSRGFIRARVVYEASGVVQ